MWLNVDISSIDEEKIIEFLLYVRKMFNNSIVFSINTSNNFDEVKDSIESLKKLIREKNIDVIFGPHFVLDGILVNDELKYVEELDFATKGDKIIWGLRNIDFPFVIEKVALLDWYLGIDPFTIKNKEKLLGYKVDYYFWYDCLDITNLDKLIKDDNFHFSRIKR